MIKKVTPYIYSSTLGPVLLIFTCLLFRSLPVHAGYDILIQFISEYNLREMKKNLEDGTYRGEAGILAVKPEIGSSLGLKVYMDEDYRAAVIMFERAEKNLDRALDELKSKKEKENELAAQIVDHFLLYKTEKEGAVLKMAAYYSRLKPGLDERLDDKLCIPSMEKLLEKSLQKTDNRLRDALAFFYNLCHGNDTGEHHLTVDNVLFVNFVYRNFMEKASAEEKVKFHFDRQRDRKEIGDKNWKDVAAEICPQFLPVFERIIPKYSKEIYEIDPLLFMALIKRESNFNPLAVSSVGAAGLAQIMPHTAVDLGMKNIHQPDYFRQAGNLLRQERKAGQEAQTVLYMINEQNGLKFARKARELMQQSISLGRKREQLFTKYKNDLLRSASDTRLDPEQALEHGLKYFLRQMKSGDGDISLALSSYNAGPHRVKQYQGIPPFEETVHFRNMVLGYYREYREKAQNNQKTAKSVQTD